VTELVIQAPSLEVRLKEKLTGVVRQYAAQRPRSQQKAIGASEIGNPCDRFLALKSLGYPAVAKRDPWATILGSAVHTYLENAFLWADSAAFHAGLEIPFRVETSVQIAPGVRGTADLYDVEEATVIDHKVPADSGMDKARKGKTHVSDTYRVQVQCYGAGFAASGFDVRHVAIAFWPRGTGAWLGGLEVVAYDYEPDIVSNACARWQAISLAAIELDLEQYPERAELFATADAPCNWCPYFNPSNRVFTDEAGERLPTCTGHVKRKRNNQ
jgi:hypothetical protein